MVETKTTYLSPLHETISTTATDFWNDSCSIEELTYAIEHGAVGATSNPTIVEQVHRQERHLWEDRIHEIIQDNPSWTEEDIMWKVFEEIGVKGAELLLPVFEREAGKKGRMSIQTNPANYRNVERMVWCGPRSTQASSRCSSPIAHPSEPAVWPRASPPTGTSYPVPSTVGHWPPHSVRPPSR